MRLQRVQLVNRQRSDRRFGASPDSLCSWLAREAEQGAAWGMHTGDDVALRVERLTVLFADLVESSQMLADDEIAGVRRIARLFADVTGAATDVGSGRLLERRGDGLIFLFRHAIDAANAASAIHRTAASFDAVNGSAFVFRIGLHCANVLDHDGVRFGLGLSMCSRVASLALPGQSLVSTECRDELAGFAHLTLVDKGRCYIKGASDPIRVFELARRQGGMAAGSLPKSQVQTSVTLAVFPLSHLSLAPANESQNGAAVGDVYADLALQAFSRCTGIELISRLSSAAAARAVRSGAQLTTVVSADYVLSGTWQQPAGDEYRFAVELMSTVDGRVVWHDSARATAVELLAPESQYFLRIVSEATHRIAGRELETSRTAPLPTVPTHSLVLSSISLMHRLGRDDFDSALSLIERVAERAPRHAVPHAWRARWHTFRVVQGWAHHDQRDHEQAKRESEMALALDDELSLVHAVAGSVAMSVKRDLPAALRHYERALSINPSDSLAWALKAAAHALDDDGAAALAAADRALTLSPHDPMRFLHESLAASACLTMHDFAGARNRAEASIRSNRAHYSSLRVAAIACELLGDHGAAARYIDELRREQPQYTVGAFLRASPKPAASDNRKLFADALLAAGLPA